MDREMSRICIWYGTSMENLDFDQRCHSCMDPLNVQLSRKLMNFILNYSQALKNLIFGSATSCFNQEWRQQSFNFCNHYGLEYGIIQHKVHVCVHTVYTKLAALSVHTPLH